MSSAQKSKIRMELAEAKQKYQEELALAEQNGYANGKNRIPKRLPIKL